MSEILHTPTLSEIVKADAYYVSHDGVQLNWSEILCFISLDTKPAETDGDEFIIYFQNEEASDLIDKAKKIYYQTGDTTMEDCIYHILKPWVDNL